MDKTKWECVLKTADGMGEVLKRHKVHRKCFVLFQNEAKTPHTNTQNICAGDRWMSCNLHFIINYFTLQLKRVFNPMWYEQNKKTYDIRTHLLGWLYFCPGWWRGGMALWIQQPDTRGRWIFGLRMSSPGLQPKVSRIIFFSSSKQKRK